MARFLLLLFLLFIGFALAEEKNDVGCKGDYIKNVGGDSLVCVCGSKGCPQLWPPHTTIPTPTTATTVTSTREGLRFKEEELNVVKGSSSSSSSSHVTIVEVAVEAPKQVMNGFGASLTDSAALTMSALSPTALDALLRMYFSPEGLEYSLLRVPIGGCDFSTRPYTYADTPSSGDLLNFALTEEDTEYKLPLLRRILSLSSQSPRVVASPWSAPAWMKTNQKINENGELLKEMYGPWADYLVKFIHEYEGAGIPIWAISTQNHAFTPPYTPWNSMMWSPEDMRDWIKGYLGPALHEAGLGRVKVYIGDETRNLIDTFLRQVLNDPEASRYITGTAVHWYEDPAASPEVLDRVHMLYPNKDILYTEACVVPINPEDAPVELGSWTRAELYGKYIIEDVNHFASGFMDWNLCLDMAGGPNWAGNHVDAPVIINQERDEFYLQPIFFIMGHFSKFVPPGSLALPSWVLQGRSDILHTAAFLHPDGYVVLQILNTGDKKVEVRVEWGKGTHLHTTLPAKALQTLLLPWEAATEHEKRKYFTPSSGHCEEGRCH